MQRLFAEKSLSVKFNVLEDHTILRKSPAIPNLTISPHLINLGYIIINTSCVYTLLFENYGPCSVDIVVKPYSKKAFADACFRMQYDRVNLPIGGLNAVTITFKPTSEKYKVVDEVVRQGMSLSVSYHFFFSIVQIIVYCIMLLYNIIKYIS